MKKVVVSEIDVTIAQINTACRLMYLDDDADLVSIQTLVGGAHGILEKIAKRMNPRPGSFQKELDAVPDKAERRKLSDDFRAGRHFVNHGDDQGRVLELNEHALEVRIALCVGLIVDLGEEKRLAPVARAAWHLFRLLYVDEEHLTERELAVVRSLKPKPLGRRDLSFPQAREFVRTAAREIEEACC